VAKLTVPLQGVAKNKSNGEYWNNKTVSYYIKFWMNGEIER